MKRFVVVALYLALVKSAFGQSAETYPALTQDDAKMCSLSLQMGGVEWKKILPPTGGEPGADISKVVVAQKAFYETFGRTVPVVGLTYSADKTDDFRLHPAGDLSWPPASVFVYDGVWLKDDVKHRVHCVYERDPWGLDIHTAVDDGAVVPPPSVDSKASKSSHRAAPK